MTMTITQHKMDDYCKNAKSIKAMADSGITHIPSEFILPVNMQPRFTKSDKSRDVPTIDLSLMNDEFQRKRIATSIMEAIKEWGVFKVVGHGISEKLKKQVLQVTREFFDLPLSDKIQFLGPNGDAAAPRYGRTRRAVSGHQSWRDQFHHRTPPFNSSELQLWPEKPEAYRRCVLDWTEEVKKLTGTVLGLLAEVLNLQPNRFYEVLGDGEGGMDATMLTAYYPPCPQADMASGIVAHTDPVSMVVINEDSPGLEVMKDGTWILVAPDPESLIVSTGDTMEIISNGRFKSCEHRVLVKEKQDRVSALVLLKPALDLKLCVAPEFTTKGEHTRFTKMDLTYREYVKNFGNKCRHDDK